MTTQADIAARVATVENSTLVQMARRLQDDLSSEATVVMGHVLAELAKRFEEEEFLAICADLDGRLANQAGLADPIHY